MFYRRLPPFLPLFLFLIGCFSYSNRGIQEGQTLPPSLPQVKSGEDEFAQQELQRARRSYALGVRAIGKEEWTKAQKHFEKAIEILADLDLDEDYPQLTQRFDLLLNQISSDYRRALASIGALPQGSSVSAVMERLQGMKISHREIESLYFPVFDPSRYDFPICWNEEVKRCIHFYQTTGRRPFVSWLKRSGRYVPKMRKLLKEAGLPQDLVYLALIESGFNPNAYSWARAVGPWQFIYSTGKLFDLRRNWWIDERKDPEKSTKAAARFLSRLYEDFQSWPLAIAAYNCGKGKVLRAIRRVGTDDFWALPLPRQTKNYVPSYMAATIIAKDPAKYGFDEEVDDPLAWDVVYVDGSTDLRVAAKCAGTTYKKIKELNPELLRWCTPPQVKRYGLKVPSGKGEVFYTKYSHIPVDKKVSWNRHKVRRGETLSQIAEMYHTSVWAIVDANSLKSRHRIIAGDYLLIPVPPSQASKPTLPKERRATRGTKIVYRIKKGDTLSQIAQGFGVESGDLRRWNGLPKGKHIYPGQELDVWIKPGFHKLSSGSGGVEKGKEKVIYVVRYGDTLWDIARGFGVEVRDICRWNGLHPRQTIYPGEKLQIYMQMDKTL